MTRYRAAVLLLGAMVVTMAACDKNPVANGDVFVPVEPVNLPVLGQGIVTARYTAEVAARDGWAYTTSWSQRSAPGNAVYVWNVGGSTPVLADSMIVPNTATLGDVQISDDGALLVVATEYRPGSIVIYDRSIPDSPAELSRFSSADTDRGVHTVKLGRVGGRHYAFLSIDPSPARLVIVDITDPANPVQVLARVMGLPYVHDVFVRDGILFTALWNDGLSIWDIGGAGKGGSPADPVLIGNVKTVDGKVHNVWWFNDPRTGAKRYAFIGEESGPFAVGSSSAGDVHVVDVSDLAAPREVAFYHVVGAGSHNFVMDEASGVLYAAFYNGGVRSLDVRGDLSQCPDSARAGDGRCDLGLAGREAGKALTTGSPPVSIWGVARIGTRLFASDMLNGIWVLDISDLVR